MEFRTKVFEVPTGQGYLSARTNGGLGLVEADAGEAPQGCVVVEVVAEPDWFVELGNDYRWRGRIISCPTDPSLEGRGFYRERMDPYRIGDIC